MDMMRPVSVALPPLKPDGLAFTITGNGNNRRLVVTWNDNSINETSFVVQRTTDGTTWTDVGDRVRRRSTSRTPHGHADASPTPTSNANTAYLYRVVAQNTVGYGGGVPEP